MLKAVTKRKKVVPLDDLRTNMGKYISRIGRGESFTIVRRSEPVFMVSPVERVADFAEIGQKNLPTRRTLRQPLSEVERKKLRKQLKEGAIAWAKRNKQIAEEWFHIDEEAWQKSGYA